MRRGAILISGAVYVALAATASAATPRHHHHRSYVQPYPEPVASPYGVQPFAYGSPAVAFVISRGGSACEYPNGFNVTDFERSVNGIPRGGHELLNSGCGAAIPF